MNVIITLGVLTFLFLFQLANKLREEIEDGEVVTVDDGSEESLPEEERAVFEALLPMAAKEVRTKYITRKTAFQDRYRYSCQV